MSFRTEGEKCHLDFSVGRSQPDGDIRSEAFVE